MKTNLNQVEEKLERKSKRREKKKPKMKISGKSVFRLRELIVKKSG